MNRSAALSSVLFISLVLSNASCTQFAESTRSFPMSRGFSVPKRAMGYDPDNKNYNANTSPTTYQYDPTTKPAPEQEYFRTAYLHAKGAEQKHVRNVIAKELASIVDENHDIYHESLRRNLTGTTIISDFLTLGLTSSAAIAGGARTAKSLAALATASTGFGSTLNSRVLQQQTLSSLLKAMTIRKDRIYAEMQLGFKKEISEYGLEDVIKDLGHYWEAGLLTGALAELDKLVSATASNVDKAKAENAGNADSTAKNEAIIKATTVK